MNPAARFRRYTTWLAHCGKALFRSYHHQLIPLFEVLLDTDAQIIDVGAHAGQFTRLFARHAPCGHVLALEPAGYPLSILRLVKTFHRLDNVTIINMAVGEKCGEATLETPVKQSGVLRFGLTRLQFNDSPAHDRVLRESVAMTTLDRLVTRYALPGRISLIKADIEGHEAALLRGAGECLEKFKPHLLLEVSAQQEEVLEHLLTRGYIVFALRNYGGKRKEALVLGEYSAATGLPARNIIAIHESELAVLGALRKSFCQDSNQAA